MFHLKTREMQRGGHNFGPKKVFSRIKSDFSRVLLDSRGYISYRDDSFPSGEDFL